MGTKGWEGWYGLGDKMHVDSQRCEISRNCAYAHKQLVRPNSQSPTAAPVPWAHWCSSSFLLPVNVRLVLLWAKYIQKLQKQLSINNNSINKTDKFQEINKLRFHRHATTIKTNASCQSVRPWGGTRPLGACRERGTRSLDPWLTPPCHQAHSSYFCSVSGQNASLLLHCFTIHLYLPSRVLEQEKKNHVQQQLDTENLLPKQSHTVVWGDSASCICLGTLHGQ